MKKDFQKVLKIYLFLFIFTMVNREFKPLGFDIRFIVLPLGVLLLIWSIIKNHYVLKFDKEDTTGNNYIKFYIVVLLCNICWIFNDLNMNQVKFINEIILIVNTFVGILVVYFNKKIIDFKFVMKSMLFSCFILSVSILLSYIGVPFKAMMGDPEEANIYYGNESVHQKNIFGNNYRCGGYASDANYATILLIYGIISVLKLKELPKYTKYILIAFFLLMIGLSFSKTILIGSVLVILYLFVFRKYFKSEKKKRIIDLIFIIIVALSILLMPFLKELLPDTLSMRIVMWRGAKDLFFKSPIIGSGITSFRSFFELSHPLWYVQSHSTFWQILSEVGIIGFMYYLRTIFSSLSNKKSLSSYYLIMVFIIWSATYETIALPLSIFPIYIMELENYNTSKNQKGEK